MEIKLRLLIARYPIDLNSILIWNFLDFFHHICNSKCGKNFELKRNIKAINGKKDSIVINVAKIDHDQYYY